MATIVIGGSTASGKSALALRIAERTDGIIVNADSVQLYRDLPILTARPGAADLARAEHLLYGILGPTEACSVAEWLERVRPLADECLRINRMLVVVGGTGFYLRSLVQGLVPMPEIDPNIRQAIRDNPVSSSKLHEELARNDPEMASKLKPNDRQRIMRALEVQRSTGKSLLFWQSKQPVKLSVPLHQHCVALLPPREQIRRRIDERLGTMIRDGLVDEVSTFLRELGDQPSPLRKADGVAEFKAHIDGEISLEEARLRTFNKVCRYAKRQRTFFRHQLKNFTQIKSFAEDISEDLVKNLCGQ